MRPEPLLLAVLLVALAPASAQQPNTAAASATWNGIDGPPWPIAADIGPTAATLDLQVAANPLRPWALINAPAGVAPGLATPIGLFDLDPSQGVSLLLDGIGLSVSALDALAITDAGGTTNLSASLVGIGTADLGGMQVLVADPTSPTSASFTAASRVRLVQPPTVYALGVSSVPGALATVDPMTGTTTPITTIPGLDGLYNDANAVDVDTGLLYVVGTDNTTSSLRLHTVDLGTGTVLSNVPIAINPGAFVVRSDGALIALEAGGLGFGSTLYTVDPSTGAATVIAGLPGLDFPLAWATAVDRQLDVLYQIAFGIGQPVQQLFSIDLYSGLQLAPPPVLTTQVTGLHLGPNGGVFGVEPVGGGFDIQQIDPLTGSLTPQGSLGSAIALVADGGAAGSDGILYQLGLDPSFVTTRIYRFDLGTGLALGDVAFPQAAFALFVVP